jgi:hypothetical protein
MMLAHDKMTFLTRFSGRFYTCARVCSDPERASFLSFCHWQFEPDSGEKALQPCGLLRFLCVRSQYPQSPRPYARGMPSVTAALQVRVRLGQRGSGVEGGDAALASWLGRECFSTMRRAAQQASGLGGTGVARPTAG